MSPLPAVSRTAIGVARVRAAEARHPDPLFVDPYAATFIEASGADNAAPDPAVMTEEQRRWRAAIAFHISIRTRFFDDYLRDAMAAGIRQIVLLGAGLDTRAFRLELPTGGRWFELDLPDVLAFKHAVLDAEHASPRCMRTAIAADLAGDWGAALTAAGFEATDPTAWLAEGLLVYLDASAAAHVLDVATSLSAAGSRLSAERGDVAQQVAALAGDERPDEASSLWQGGIAGGVAGWLTENGWRAKTYDVADVARSYGRQPPASARSGFVIATR